jgi:hypothetical protein
MDLQDLLNESGEGGQNQKKESPLKSLETDLKLYSDSIKEVATEIRVEGISEYPVFVAHQHELKLGEVILDRHELNTEWTIHAATLEELVEKGIIQHNKKDHFIQKFKDADRYMCLLVVVPEGANFVFYPYQ